MQGVTIERLERGLAVLAHCIMRDGPVYAPLFEKLERELESLRARDDTVSRAKRLLIENLVTGNMKLPRYVERDHRGSLSFRVDRGAHSVAERSDDVGIPRRVFGGTCRGHRHGERQR